jgi:hypothetical protein
MAKIFIYALHCPKTDEIRYIGKANNPDKRFSGHLRETRRKTPLYDWIEKLRNNGLTPKISIVSEVDNDNWKEEEINQIKLHIESGCRLLNLAKGGDEPFCSKEQRAINGRDNAKAIHSDDKKKRVWYLKKQMGASLKWMKENNRKETYNRVILKLKEAAKKNPKLFGCYASLEAI